MNGYNFTERVRRALSDARKHAVDLGHEYVGTEHILLGLLDNDGVAPAALESLGVDLKGVSRKIYELVKPRPADSTVAAAAASGGLLGAIAETIGLQKHGPDLPYTSRAKKSLELAMTEARDLDHTYVGTEHLLLGLMREERGVAAQVLTSFGITVAGLREETLRLLGAELPERSVDVAPKKPRDDAPDVETAITLVIEHGDGRIEAKKFRKTEDAVSFLNGLER
jgi:ATP-dependent Clp protease ATP-binding subunit ClpC